MHCRYCGTEFDDTFEYCPNCSGYQKEGYAESNRGIFPGFTTTGSPSSFKATGGFLFLVLIVGIILMTGFAVGLSAVVPDAERDRMGTPTPEIMETPTPTVTPPEEGPTPTPEATPTPAPAEFDLIETSLEGDEITASSSVIVTAKVENIGDLAGTFMATLEEDGVIVDSTERDILPGEVVEIEFERQIDNPGFYEFGINDEHVGEVFVRAPHDYEIVVERDVSYATVVRLVYHVITDEPLADFSEQDFLLIAQEITAVVTNEQDVNAIGISFHEQESDAYNNPQCVGVDWAPYGDWARAGEVETGDYEHHEYDYTDNRDATGYDRWCESPND